MRKSKSFPVGNGGKANNVTKERVIGEKEKGRCKTQRYKKRKERNE